MSYAPTFPKGKLASKNYSLVWLPYRWFPFCASLSLRFNTDVQSIHLRFASDDSSIVLRSFLDSRTENERRMNGERTENNTGNIQYLLLKSTKRVLMKKLMGINGN